MKTIIKLLIVAAVLHACVRGAMAAWSYYEFRDAAYQTILFGGGSSVGELEAQIMRRAEELQVPIDPQNLEVTRDGPRTMAEAAYTQRVELLPSYRYPFNFSFTVDAMAVNPTTASEAPPGQ